MELNEILEKKMITKCELYNDHFENAKKYNIPRAQLIVADIPYQLGNNAYASNPQWYKDGDNSKGESELAGKTFFKTEETFKIPDLFWFATRLLKPEPKEPNKAPCMVVFCAFQQIPMLIEEAEKQGLKKYIPLIFIKNFSAQVLKANMKIVNACEYGLLFYRDKLPKFRNGGKMIFNWFNWGVDNTTPKVHTTQKPVPLLKKLIEVLTDVGDVVIDPLAGSGSTLRASYELGRHSYGFEVEKQFYKDSKEKVLSNMQQDIICLTQKEEKAMCELNQINLFKGAL